MDAGAEFIITQLFYDIDTFVEWEKECRKIGRHYLYIYIYHNLKKHKNYLLNYLIFNK